MVLDYRFPVQPLRLRWQRRIVCGGWTSIPHLTEDHYLENRALLGLMVYGTRGSHDSAFDPVALMGKVSFRQA